MELHIAASENQLETLRSLIEGGRDVNERNDMNDIPLHWACEQGHMEIIRFLVEKGADYNLKNNVDFFKIYSV